MPAALASHGGLAQTNWVMATPYADGNFHTVNIRQFAEDLRRATAGRLSITVHAGGSLLPLPQIKRAVQSGQIQLGETLVSSLANEDAVFEADTVPFLAQGFAAALRLHAASRPFVERRLARQGLSMLFSVPWPTQGIFTRNPVATTADLRGARMRTYNPTTNRFAELLGALPTTVQAAEVPQAFATGIVNAMITSAATAVDTQAWDYVRYYYDVRAMHSRNMVLMNTRLLAGLDPATRSALAEAARLAEERGWAAAEAAEAQTTATIAARGIAVERPSDALAEGLGRVGRTMSAEWVQRAGEDGQAILQAIQAA